MLDTKGLDTDSKQKKLFNEIDKLVGEDEKLVPKFHNETGSAVWSIKSFEEIISRLKSSSSIEREISVEILSSLGPEKQIDITNCYYNTLDQDIRMGLVKAMSMSKKTYFAEALIDAIGLEIVRVISVESPQEL